MLYTLYAYYLFKVHDFWKLHCYDSSYMISTAPWTRAFPLFPGVTFMKYFCVTSKLPSFLSLFLWKHFED